jgi:hypothetical protein
VPTLSELPNGAAGGRSGAGLVGAVTPEAAAGLVVVGVVVGAVVGGVVAGVVVVGVVVGAVVGGVVAGVVVVGVVVVGVVVVGVVVVGVGVVVVGRVSVVLGGVACVGTVDGASGGSGSRTTGCGLPTRKRTSPRRSEAVPVTIVVTPLAVAVQVKVPPGATTSTRFGPQLTVGRAAPGWRRPLARTRLAAAELMIARSREMSKWPGAAATVPVTVTSVPDSVVVQWKRAPARPGTSAGQLTAGSGRS